MFCCHLIGWLDNYMNEQVYSCSWSSGWWVYIYMSLGEFTLPLSLSPSFWLAMFFISFDFYHAPKNDMKMNCNQQQLVANSWQLLSGLSNLKSVLVRLIGAMWSLDLPLGRLHCLNHKQMLHVNLHTKMAFRTI